MTLIAGQTFISSKQLDPRLKGIMSILLLKSFDKEAQLEGYSALPGTIIQMWEFFYLTHDGRMGVSTESAKGILLWVDPNSPLSLVRVL